MQRAHNNSKRRRINKKMLKIMRHPRKQELLARRLAEQVFERGKGND